MDERGGRMEVLLVQTVKYIRGDRGCCERSEIKVECERRKLCNGKVT